MRWLLAAVLFAACSYAPQRSGGLAPGDDAPPLPPDTPPGFVCTPGVATCNGRNLETCNAAGDGLESNVVCPLSCDAGACTQASNLAAPLQAGCLAEEAPPFVVPAGATTVQIGSNLQLTCTGDANCPGPIDPMRIELGDIDLAFYCLSSLTIPDTKTLQIASGLDAAILLFVAGDAAIDGRVRINGQNAGTTNGGQGGAGGFAGAVAAAQAEGNGVTGNGTCGGVGGKTSNANDNVGSGGGGGGGSTAGGQGGNGRDDNGNVPLGGAGGAICGVATLEPLVGGSGGGSGGDGLCNNRCGSPGGGGGGAIQIVATGTLSVGGAIEAIGGSGDSNQGEANVDGRGGGGGGGAGGAILLEAPVLAITGTLDVSGGRGGNTGARMGGAGGTPTTTVGTGGSGNSNDQGGAGGGGAQGRIRLNGSTGATCPVATNDPCTSGALKRP